MECDINYAEKLNQNGIRPSIQRIAIYKYLYENRIHPTVDTVYKSLYPLYPTLSRTTVYNTLHLFVTQKLIQTVKIEEEEVRYDAELKHHGHFKCVNCGTITDLMEDNIFDNIDTQLSSILPKGSIAYHQELNIWGLCPNCSKKNN